MSGEPTKALYMGPQMYKGKSIGTHTKQTPININTHLITKHTHTQTHTKEPSYAMRKATNNAASLCVAYVAGIVLARLMR